MNAIHRILTSAVWLGGTFLGLGELTVGFGFVEPSNNLERAYFGRDIISESEWDAQSFDRGDARQLKVVALNLYRDPDVTPVGTYWVRVCVPNGVDGAPATNGIASVAENRPISELETNVNHVVVFHSLSIPLNSDTPYFVVVGGNPGAAGLLWGYTDDPVGATGFPSLFTFSGDGGSTWRTPFMNALPQRMRIIGETSP